MEKYAEVLLSGPPSGPDGVWLPPAFGSLAQDITAAVMSEVEEYAQPGDEAAARAVRRVARDAVAGFAARRLHVHPQTIRYRLRQVSELFGDALGEPDTRFQLLLALRARLLLGA